MKSSEVIIVGGGIAGITLSIELLKQNIPHILIEAKKNIGGRAFSFVDTQTNSTIDNGQHLLSSAYNNFFNLIKSLGTDNYLYYPNGLDVPFLDFNGKIHHLKNSGDNSKFGLLRAIIRFSLLPFKSKIKLLVLLRKLISINISNLEETSLDKFLKQNNQDSFCLEYFWSPLALSVMNNFLENIPTALFIRTFQIAFFNGSSKSQLIFPRVGLSNLFEPFYKIAESSKLINLVLKTRIVKIKLHRGFFELTTKENNKFYCKTLFLCVPPNHLEKMITEEWKKMEYFTFLKNLTFNPITSVYLWFTRPILDDFFCALPSSQIQWIFNRNKIESNLSNKIFLYNFTSSNSRDLIQMCDDDIVKLIISELRTRLKKDIPDPIHFRVFKDKFATVNINIEFERQRPKQNTPIRNLFLAGDWTKTGLPATIESAAKSAVLAFEFFRREFND